MERKRKVRKIRGFLEGAMARMGEKTSWVFKGFVNMKGQKSIQFNSKKKGGVLGGQPPLTP